MLMREYPRCAETMILTLEMSRCLVQKCGWREDIRAQDAFLPRASRFDQGCFVSRTARFFWRLSRT
jgi:hypothetical protein